MEGSEKTSLAWPCTSCMTVIIACGMRLQRKNISHFHIAQWFSEEGRYIQACMVPFITTTKVRFLSLYSSTCYIIL